MKPFTINNIKILSFFDQRPELDVETTLLKFIDIMETLQESMNKTLTIKYKIENNILYFVI